MYVGKELLIPAPIRVLEEFLSLAGTAEFWKIAFHSLLRIFSGAAIGVLAGCFLAFLTSVFGLADAILAPAVRFIRATPVASFIVLLLLWVHRDIVPIIISALIVLPIVWGDVCAGIATCPAELLEFGRAYRLSGFKIWRYIRWPFIIPYLSSGVYLSLGMAWKSGVAAEVLSLPHSAIGTEIYNTKLYLETPALFAWTFVVIALSAILESLIRMLLELVLKDGGTRSCF